MNTQQDFNATSHSNENSNAPTENAGEKIEEVEPTPAISCETLPSKTNPKSSKACGKRKKTGAMYRKAPQAPKRFKPAYICFSMAKHKEIKKELGPDSTVSDVSKRISQVWHALPPNERAHWDQAAEDDKKRYEAEKAAYTGPWKILSKPSKTDANAPKRPMSSFLYYAQKYRPVVKKENPELCNTEVSKLLGVMWKSASEDEKKKYIQHEEAQRALYNTAISEWHKKQAKNVSSPPDYHQEITSDDTDFLSPNYSAAYPTQFDNGNGNNTYMEQQQTCMQPYNSYPPAPHNMMPPTMSYGMFSPPPHTEYPSGQYEHAQPPGYQNHNNVPYSYPPYGREPTYSLNTQQEYHVDSRPIPNANDAYSIYHPPVPPDGGGHGYYNRSLNNAYPEYGNCHPYQK